MKFYAPSFVVAIACAAVAIAQSDATKPEIHGAVIEPGIERGVAEAEISIFLFQGNQVGKVTTDSQGKFHFQPTAFGQYRVVASKEGYGGDTSLNVTLSTSHPSREADFRLGRTGEITGRVVDEESGEPLVNFRIEAASFSYRFGHALTDSSTLANTDEDGRFTVGELAPGRYVVIARPRTRVSPPSSSDAATDYEMSYWPGGRQLDTAAPVTLISGGSADVGVMRLRKTKLYSVRVAISDTNCAVGESVHISTSNGSGEGECGETALLRNFQPGSYRLALTQGQKPSRSMAILSFDVVDKDVDLTAVLARDVGIDGRLIADRDVKIPFEKLRIWIADVSGTRNYYGETVESPQPDAEGRFRLFSQAPFGKFSISLVGPGDAKGFSIDRGYYIKEIRLNGELVPNNLVALAGSVAAQSLEIVVDDQPATVAGVVNDGDHPASKPFVLIVEWPLPAELGFASQQGDVGDEDGQFRIAGLAPGEYRAVAVSQANRDRLDEPGVLPRILRGAETIKLTRGSVQTVTLKLTDPAR